MEYNPKELVPGDILLFKRNKKGLGIISNLIRLIQGNQYVHVAIVLSPTPDPMVAEIDSGIPSRIVGYSEVTKRGIPEIYRLRTDQEYCGWKVYEEARLSEGAKYGYAKIANAMINHLLGRIIPGYKYSNWIKSDKEICSTYVSRLLSQGFGTKYDNVSEPDDYCKEPFYRIL